MAVFTLPSLVLRGVSVAVCGGQNVGLRLGAESQTVWQTPEVRINPRHPSPNGERRFTPAPRPDDHAEYDRMAAMAAFGAGRSHCRDGVHSRRSPARIAAKRLPTSKRNAAVQSARLWPADRTPSTSTWAS
jgi:hypothetical protein